MANFCSGFVFVFEVERNDNEVNFKTKFQINNDADYDFCHVFPTMQLHKIKYLNT